MYVCVYNFYLNKLFKLFILLKEIILIIKIHIQRILNIYNLFSKFYFIYIYIYRERERERERDARENKKSREIE